MHTLLYIHNPWSMFVAFISTTWFVFLEGILWRCTNLNQMFFQCNPCSFRSIKVKILPCRTRLQTCNIVVSIPTNINSHIIRYPQPVVYVQSIWIKQFCWGTSLLVTCLLVKETASWPELAHILSYISKSRQVTPTWIVDVGLINGWRKCCFLKWNELHLLDKDRTNIRSMRLNKTMHLYNIQIYRWFEAVHLQTVRDINCHTPSHGGVLFFSRNLGNDDAICWAPHSTFLHFALEAFKPSRVGARKCCFGESWTALICREYWMAGAAGGGDDVRKLRIIIMETWKGQRSCSPDI